MSSLTAERALIFRITHIDNVPWILANGLHCRNSAGTLDPNYREIGNADLIAKRAHREISIPPGGTLSDYIPFYFTPFSPMLLNIKTGFNGVTQTPMQQIVILVSSLRKLENDRRPFVYSDRHAYLATAQFSSSLGDLNRIDWKILQARDFKRDPNDPGKFERYQAEALPHRHLPVNALLGIVCYGPAQNTILQNLTQSAGVSLTITAKPDWYF